MKFFNRSGNNFLEGFRKFCLLLLLLPLANCKTTFKAMDVNAKGNFDFNLLPLNPNWQFFLDNNALPDVTQLCPVNSDNPDDWKNSSTCTSDYIYLNQATGFNKIDCWVHDRGGIEGHMNWFPVSYEGSLFWDSHSDPPGDDDYNFDLCRNDKALYTTQRTSMHTEFDSDETVDNWDDTNTWWENFHEAVDNDDAKAHAMLNGNFAIVIGLLGIDGGHSDFKSELHPAYGMFVHTNDDPSNDKWAFFIRNWGDEGSCSDNQEYLDKTILLVFLPHENTDDVSLGNANIWSSNIDPGMGVSFEKVKDGLLLIFTFGKPENKGCYVGDIGFVWKGPNLSPRHDFNQNPLNPSSQTSSLIEEDRGDENLVKDVNQLNADSKKELIALLGGKQISSEFKLFPKPRMTRVKPEMTQHVNSDSIQKRILQLKNDKQSQKNNEIISHIVRTVPDSSTFMRKQLRHDLIIKYLKSKGIE